MKKKREYSLATEKLIDRMCRYVEREDFVLNKKKAEECVLKTYDLFNLPRPKKIMWCVDIFDKTFEDAAGSAWSAWSARSAGSAWSAWSAWSARSLGWTALDDDFYYYVFDYEYCKNPTDKKPNKYDKQYLKYSELLLRALEYGVGYRVEYEDTLYLVPTPIVRIDKEKKFHSLTEPAMRWKDGKELFYVHGISVDEKIIKYPEQLTKEDWSNQSNLEVRRVIQDQMPDFAKKIGGKTISKDKKGELIEVELPRDPERVARYVKVKDSSTPRVYFLRVPPTTKTCTEGVAWTFGFSEVDYSPEIET